MSSISFEIARHQILEATRPLGLELVTLLDAAGRVMGEPVRAPWDMPLFNNSAMDGFAVRSADCMAVPVELKIIGYIPAGGLPEPAVTPGCAVRIMTGAPLPPGCDAIVPVEETEEATDTVRILKPVASMQHVRVQGEDVTAGDVIVQAATLIRPPEISMLASMGQVTVPVHRRPRVAILSTGDELIELWQTPQPGRIINANSHSLAAAVKECGAEPVLLGIARDDHQDLLDKLSAGLACDVLITSAGVSAGDRDMVREVLAELGVRQKFWKVDIKPGRPTAFGVKGKTLVFSLPGNPVSTMVTFEYFVRPALLKMQGCLVLARPTVTARLLDPEIKKAGRVHFLRVQVKEVGASLIAASAGDQNTGMLSTMVRANGIALLPAERESFAAGEQVEVTLLGPIVTT